MDGSEFDEWLDNLPASVRNKVLLHGPVEEANQQPRAEQVEIAKWPTVGWFVKFTFACMWAFVAWLICIPLVLCPPLFFLMWYAGGAPAAKLIKQEIERKQGLWS